MSSRFREGGLRQLLASASANVAASVGAALSGLVSTAVMARELTVADFGRVLLMVTAANAFAIFEGLRPVIIYRVAARIDDPALLFATAARVNAIMAAVTLACLLLAVALGWTGQTPTAALAVLSLTVLAFFAAMQYWSFLDAESDTFFTGIARGGGWIAVYVAFAGLAKAGAGLTAFAVVLLAMNLGQALLFRYRLCNLGVLAKPRPDGQAPALSGLLRMAINNIAFNLSAVTINVVDRAIVGATLGAGPAGLYSGPSELALRASGLVRAAVQVILPWAARQGDEAGRRQRIWLAATTVLVLVAGAGCASVLLVRHEVATLLLGRSFRTTGDLLGLFSVTVLMSAMGYACIVYLNARGNFSTQRRLYGIAALALVVGALYGAKQGSLTLVAMAFVTARGVDLILVATILRECQPEDVRRFLLLAAAMTSALACAWAGQMALTSLLLAISIGLGLSLWRSIGVASR